MTSLRNSLGFVVALVVVLGGCSAKKTTSQPEKVEPNADLRYQVARQFSTGMEEPRGITVHDGEVIVVGDKKLSRMTPTGTVISSIDLTDSPKCVTTDAQGAFYLGCGDHVTMVKENAYVIWPSFGPKTNITSVAATKDAIWVADAGNRRVLKCSLDGKKIEVFGKKSADYDGVIIPSPHFDLVALPDGNLLWTNPGARRVEVHDANGKMLSFWGRDSQDNGGFCGCCNPTDIALLADGKVVTSEKGLPRVSLFREGKFVGLVAAAESRSEKAVGLDLATLGDNVFVLDPFAKNITQYAPLEAKP